MNSSRPAADLAARQLYQAHAHSLRRYAEQLTGDPHRAEDLVQETLLRAWLNADRLIDNAAARRAWLFRVARNIAIDDVRARRARPTEVYTEPAAAGATTGTDGTERLLTSIEVHQALRRLTPEHRSVLFEIFYHGRTTREAARKLRIPHGTAKSRMYYGLRHFREAATARGLVGAAAGRG